MAEVNTGRTARTRRSTVVSDKAKSDLEIKRMLAETQDQLSLIHGVLEELCERQEALAAWQMEFSKRLVSLQEAQWRSLEDLAGVDMGRPVERAFGMHFEQIDADDEADQLDAANRMMDEVNSHALPKKADRMRKRRDPMRPQRVPSEEDLVPAQDEVEHHESAVESVFIMPAKLDVH